jgi:glycosyltransferase involved in cell wall biosynthesis
VGGVVRIDTDLMSTLPMQSLSVVLCTFERANKLSKAVHSIYAAACRTPGADVELIIVDNGSTDKSLELAHSLAIDAPIRIQVLSEMAKGLCRAKNRGIKAAGGQIVAFTDDDCEWAPDYLEVLLRSYRDDTRPAIKGGRVELGDPSDLPFTIKTESGMEIYDGSRHPGGFALGCNLSVPRTVFEMIGLFDENFGSGAPFRSAEDTDLVYRAFKAGVPILYIPDLVVYHHHGRKTISDISNVNWGYQIGNGALHAKHGLADGLLLRSLYYNGRNMLLEVVGGPKFDHGLGISHRQIAVPQMLGIGLYLIGAIGLIWKPLERNRQRRPRRWFR